MLHINLLALILLLSSCSGLSKKKAAPVAETKPSVEQKVVEDIPLEKLSENKKRAVVAQKEVALKRDDSRIVGSAKIQKPQAYKQRTYFLYGAEHLNLENYYFDIPVVYNKAVKKWINYFLNRGRGFFERYSARAGRYAPILGRILEDHGLPRDLIFLAMAESGFQNKAKSWAKAVGPWQFMPYTGRRFGLEINWYKDERRDPIKATIAASRYLAKLYNDFGSWELAAAAYNAGEGKVGRAIRRYRTENFWRIRKGRYLKAETKNYVPKIMALAILGKNLKSFGFEEIDFHEPLDFEEISVKGATDLMLLSNAMGVEFEEIQRLNPEILRWFTPPGEKYKLRVPPGFKEQWEDCCANQTYTAALFQEYKVRGKRTRLRDVARKFKIKNKEVLTWLNDKGPKTRLARNSIVLLPFRQGQSKKAAMYADLYERPRKSVRRRRAYRSRIRLAKRRGKRITNPQAFYTVQRGDTLWSVSRKTGTSLDTLIVSNLKLVKRRMIRAGDRLVVR